MASDTCYYNNIPSSCQYSRAGKGDVPVGSPVAAREEALQVEDGARVHDQLPVVALRHRALLVPEQNGRRLVHWRGGEGGNRKALGFTKLQHDLELWQKPSICV